MRGLKRNATRRGKPIRGSHLLQMRGLKRRMRHSYPAAAEVASFTDAWIETRTGRPVSWAVSGRIFYRCVDWNQHGKPVNARTTQSHLLQMRGLKQLGLPETATEAESHLLQMRGLKLAGNKLLVSSEKSHLLQMRGLKHPTHRAVRHPNSRIFYRCVDWNMTSIINSLSLISRIFYRCVDWNPLNCALMLIGIRRIFYRCVDWNWQCYKIVWPRGVASFTDAWIET